MARRRKPKPEDRKPRQRNTYQPVLVTATTGESRRKKRREAVVLARTIPIKPIVLPFQKRPRRSGRGNGREDRRNSRPEIIAPLLGERRGPRLVSKGKRIAFDPLRPPQLCQKRHERREVMFARGKAGSRKKQRRPRRNRWSHISCRR